MKRVTSLLAAGAMTLMFPGAAAAEWYVNPFFGKLAKVVFSEPTKDGPSVLGISGGTDAGGFVGGEFDFAHSNEFFGSKADFGSNNFRTITGSVVGGYPIKINGQTRLRPYATFGGGLGIGKRGEFQADFNFIDGLPFDQQQQIFDCLFTDEEPSRDQITACGVPVIEESETGHFGLLSYGGGVFGFIVPHVGVRADFRYFREVGGDDNGGEKLHFWRYTFGVVIH